MKFLSLLLFTALSLQLSLAQEKIPLRHIPKGDKMEAYRYTGDILGHKIWGFVTGHNFFRDYEWAEKYEIKGKADIYRIISHHGGIITDKSKKAVFKIYAVDDKGLPKDSLGGKQVTYGDIDVKGGETITEFDKPVAVEDEFFVSFYVVDYAHNPQANDKDTIIILTSEDGSRKGDDLKVFGRNVVKQHGGVGESGKWTDLATGLEHSDLEAYLALFPVVQFEDNSINESYFKKGGITFYPVMINKTTNEAILKFELNSPQELKIELLDATGKLIRNYNTPSLDQGINTKNIDLGNLKTGVYIFTLYANGIRLAQSFNIAQ